jgi:transcriptional antiterminator Rof (Rho-off)
MYNFGGWYYIDPAEIVAVEKHDNEKAESYKFTLTVRMRDGKEYSIAYSTKAARDKDAVYINNAVDNQRNNASSLETVRHTVRSEMENLRRDIRELKRLVKTGESGR